MVGEKEKFAAMLAQREDTGYNWTEHWRVNSKGVCMTAKMREDRETITTTSTPLNTMDEMAYRELEAENKKLKKRAEEAEGETTIVKGIGINSPEMRGLQTENKNLKNSLGDANDKITVLQLQSKPSQEEKKDWKVTLSYNIRHDDTYLIQNETEGAAIYIAENQNTR